jgi:hypothetical protein
MWFVGSMVHFRCFRNVFIELKEAVTMIGGS